MKNQKNYEHLIKLGKHFIKGLKTEGLYRQFLEKNSKSIGNGMHLNNSNGALFDAMMKDVRNLVRMDLHHKGRDIDQIDNEYEYITNIINMLLHKYIEGGLHIHPERCAKLGEKIFNAFCADIFGEEKFKKDMDDFHAAHAGEMGNEAMLKKEYAGLRKRGLNLSWEDFLNIKSKLMPQLATESRIPTPFDPIDFEPRMVEPSVFYINNIDDNDEDDDVFNLD